MSPRSYRTWALFIWKDCFNRSHESFASFLWSLRDGSKIYYLFFIF